MYLGFFEDLRDCPKKLLSEIFAFVGVSQQVDWGSFPYQQIIHAGLKSHMPQKFRAALEEMYCEEIEKLALRLGERVKPWRCGRK